MSQAVADTVSRAGSETALGRIKRRLRPYRPRWRDRRFVVLQVLVITLATSHIVLDMAVLHGRFDLLYFLPVSLLLGPVVYAALTYGFVGAVATALWVIALTIPDLVLWHDGLERIGVIFELILLSGIASFIGLQVERERGLRQQTEKVAAALRASTMKYQGLLESSPIAILVIKPAGAILEVNPAATVLFGKEKGTLEGMQIADLFGSEGGRRLLGNLAGPNLRPDPITVTVGGREVFLESRLTQTDDGKGNPVIQVLLRDATEEYQRRAGLQAYAAEVLRALEEERQLMARELHDETIQTLILLCRQLDNVGEIAAPLPAMVVTKVKEARASAENVVEGLRDFARSLRPPILDDLGITVSIRRLLADFTERTKIEGQIMVSGQDRRLPSDTELGIFRITQEALRNIERHAKASYVAVIITFVEHEARLDIVDNGIGFAMPVPSGYFSTSAHLGLISMQERAQLLGGRLEIHSDPGKGTKVTLSIPYADNASRIVGHHLEL